MVQIFICDKLLKYVVRLRCAASPPGVSKPCVSPPGSDNTLGQRRASCSGVVTVRLVCYPKRDSWIRTDCLVLNECYCSPLFSVNHNKSHLMRRIEPLMKAVAPFYVLDLLPCLQVTRPRACPKRSPVPCPTSPASRWTRSPWMTRSEWTRSLWTCWMET